MILTKEQIEKRLNSSNNLANKVEESRNNPITEIIIKDGTNNHVGRPGSKNLTEQERVAVGVISATVGDEVAASLFGISTSHANDLRNGNRNVGNGETNLRVQDTNLKAQIKERLDNTKMTIQERAAEKLLTSLGLLTEDKLTNCSPKDVASISNQMSQVMRNMNNNKDTSDKASVKIVLHQPKTTQEDSFDIIEIGVG